MHKNIEIETLLYIEFEMSTEIIDGLSLILHLFLLFAEYSTVPRIRERARERNEREKVRADERVA